MFEALWAERADVPLAGLTVPGAGWAGSVLISALHSLRRPDAPRSSSELRALVPGVAAATPQGESLRRLARVTGAAHTAAPVLAALDLSPEEAEVRLDLALASGELAQAAGVRGVTWATALRGRPLQVWPSLLARAMFGQSPAALRSSYPQAPPGRRGLWLARLWRFRDVMRQLPAAVRALRSR